MPTSSLPLGAAPERERLDSRATLTAVSELAAESFATIEEAIEATLDLMRRLLGMEVRMVNQIVGDQLTFKQMQKPPDMPDLQGVVTPLNHNF
jgi:hypothetical protein